MGRDHSTGCILQMQTQPLNTFGPGTIFPGIGPLLAAEGHQPHALVRNLIANVGNVAHNMSAALRGGVGLAGDVAPRLAG